MPITIGDMEERPRKRVFRKKFFRKRRPTAKSNSRAIRKLQSHIELKDHSSAIFTFPQTIPKTAWTLSPPLNGIQQGDTSVTRTGDRINMTSLKWMGVLRPVAPLGVTGPAAYTQVIRFIVVMDHQSNGTQLTSANVVDTLLSDETVSPGSVTSPFDQSAIVRPGRYKVLHNEMFTLFNRFTATGQLSLDPHIIKRKVKLHSQAIYDDDVSASIPVTNAIYALFISDASDQLPQITDFRSQLIFKDA